MPAWSFKRRFERPLENGIARASGQTIPHPGNLVKLSTIRLPRRDGRDPEAGTDQRIWIAQRTKGRRFLGTVRILRRLPITIDRIDPEKLREGRGWRLVVLVDGEQLRGDRLRALTRGEGFAETWAFFDFFRTVHGLPFRGFLYRW